MGLWLWVKRGLVPSCGRGRRWFGTLWRREGSEDLRNCESIDEGLGKTENIVAGKCGKHVALLVIMKFLSAFWDMCQRGKVRYIV